MPGSLGSLNIQLTLDQIKFQNALTKAEQRAQTFSRRTQKYLNNIDAAMTSLNKSSKVTNLLLGKDMLSTLSRGIQTTLRYADANTEVINKLRLVTNGSTALTAATNSVFEIALRTNQELDTTAQIYQRLSQNAETLHLSQERVASITETINKAVAMSGASAASAQAALMQFGQALASGVLRGEEFNSLSDQTPAILDAIAKGLGVTRGELREMAKAGKLTMDVVIPALEKVKDSVDTDFSKRIKTVSQAFTNLETSFVKTIGSFNESIGVTDFLAENIELVAANLEEAIKAAVIFGGVLAIGQLGKYSGLLLTSSINSAKSAIAHKKEAQAIYEQATATRVAAEANLAKLKTNLELTRSNKKKATLRKKIKIQTAEIIGLVNAEAAAKRNLLTVNRLLNVATRGLNAVMGLLGGPAGVVMLAGGALWYFSSQAEKARNWALDTTRANQQLTESYEDLSVAALSLRVTEQLKEIERLNDEVGKARGGLLTSQISTDFEGFTVMGNTDEQEMEKLKLEIQTIKENAEKAKQVLSKMLEPLVQKMKNSGKSFDEIRSQLELLGVDSETVSNTLNSVAKRTKEVKKETDGAKIATIDFTKAQQNLMEKSNSLRAKLEVLELKNKGHAKASYVLAGLYETLGVKGAEYSKVLNAIANGDVVAAKSAAEAIKLSSEQLNTMLDMGNKIGKLFETDQQTQTIEMSLKDTGEDYRKSWGTFYDDLLSQNRSSLQAIEKEEEKAFNKLNEFIKKGVVSHQDAVIAKIAIEKRFYKQKQELANKYSPKKQAKMHLEEELNTIRELQKAGQLTAGEATKAGFQAQFNYAQEVSQSTVDPVSQYLGANKPNQDLDNQQAQELAMLDELNRQQEVNEQKLISEEEYQKRRQEIIEKYETEKQKREMEAYSQSASLMSSAFDTMAGVMGDAAGKQSKAYKAMFAISKGFAIAEASVNAGLALSEAAKLPFPQNMVEYAKAASQTARIISTIQSVQASFATGGYTGDGGKYTPAGVVHKGEYVITKEATSRLGRGFLDQLNYGVPRRGFANGGGVGVPNLPTPKYRLKPSSPNVTVKVINNGEPTEAAVKTERDGNNIKVTVELMKQIAREETHNALVNGFVRSGGQYNRR